MDTAAFTFRWFGVQALELVTGGSTLLIDPFVTRPWLLPAAFSPLHPDEALAQRLLPQAEFILVSHTHYDHAMDVPGIARRTGARVFGSPNTGRLLTLSGIPAGQFQLVRPGDHLSLGQFEVEVFANQHVGLPVDPLINGPLRRGLRPPLRLWDYRMDSSFGFSIRTAGIHILFCPGPLQPCDVLFASNYRRAAAMRALLQAARPRLFVPVHWEYFFAPLDRPFHSLTLPGRMGPDQLRKWIAQNSPGTTFLIPPVAQPIELLQYLASS